MRNITLNLDKQVHNQKPEGKAAIGGIQQRLANGMTTVTVEELATYLHNGATMKAAALTSNNNASWVSQDVFAIDVDNKNDKEKRQLTVEEGYLSLEDALARCEAYGITPAFGYTTFSHQEGWDKYRLVFIADQTITDIRLRNAMQIAIMTLFPEADKQCKDLSRVFFGSAQGAFEVDYEATIDPLDLIQAAVGYVKETNSNGNDVKIIKKYCEAVGLNLKNGLPHIDIIIEEENDAKMEETPRVHYIYYRTLGKTSKNDALIFYFNIEQGEYSIRMDSTDGKKGLPKVKVESYKEKAEIVKDFDFETLETECPLYQDLLAGEYVHHESIFGIATNLWRCEGGQDRMLKALENNARTYGSKLANKMQTITYCAKMQYGPKRCEDHCPYYNTCNNTGINMLGVGKTKRNAIKELRQESCVTITPNQGATILMEELNNVLTREGEDLQVTLLKGPTAIGKTRMIIDLKEVHGMDLSNTIYCYPTHKLGDDTLEELGQVYDHIHLKDVTPSHTEWAAKYNKARAVGNSKGALTVLGEYVSHLKQEAREHGYKKERTEEMNKIEQYIADIKEVRTTSKLICCTHAKMLSVADQNQSIETIICDEDIFLSTLFVTKELKREEIDLMKTIASLAKAPTVQSAAEHLLSIFDGSGEGFVKTVEKFTLNPQDRKAFKEKCEEFGLEFNPMEYFNIGKVSITNGVVYGAYKNNLPSNVKNIVIMSATANTAIYEAALGTKVNVIEVNNIESEGDIVLHYMSTSRSAMSRVSDKTQNKNIDKIINRIKEEAPGVNNVITFKSFESAFKKEGFNTICNFGNCAGFNAYAGQDLVVVGTPHVNPVVYKLLFSFLSDEHMTGEFEVQTIQRNGFEFSFNTNTGRSTKPGQLLHEIQMYLIESELIQAVGRARTLRRKCTVHLFANLPVPGCKLYR